MLNSTEREMGVQMFVPSQKRCADKFHSKPLLLQFYGVSLVPVSKQAWFRHNVYSVLDLASKITDNLI